MKNIWIILISFLLFSCSLEDGEKISSDGSFYTTKYATTDREVFGFFCDEARFITYHTRQFIKFIPDSVYLVQLDSSLNTVKEYGGDLSFDGNWYACDPDREFSFAAFDFPSPYVQIVATGYWLNQDSVKVPAEMQLIGDLGRSEYFSFSLSEQLTFARIKYLVQQKLYPFTVAKSVAERELQDAFGEDWTWNGENMALLFAYIDDSIFVNLIDKISETFAKEGTWNDSDIRTQVADSLLSVYGDSNAYFSNYYANAFNMPVCNGDTLLAKVQNKASIFNGTSMVCDSAIWRFQTLEEDSLGACTSYNDGDTLQISDSLIYVCTKSRWHIGSQTELLNYYLGTCTKKRRIYGIFDSTYYYCNTSGIWKSIVQIDYDLGYCDEDATSGMTVEYKGNPVSCGSGRARYTYIKCDESGCKQGNVTEWYYSSEEQIIAYDSLQAYVRDSLQGLDTAATGIFTYEKDSVVYHSKGTKNFDFYNVDSIYNKSSGKGYPIIVAANMLWMKGSPNTNLKNDSTSATFFKDYLKDDIISFNFVTSEYYYTLKNAETQCPNGFHVPDSVEWNRFLINVEHGIVPDKDYAYIYFVLRSKSTGEFYTRTISVSWTSSEKNESTAYCLADGKFVECAKDTYGVSTPCVMTIKSGE
ncbi:MAG: hypothetical protein WCR04_09455 [Fibrobacteraceae bacterium]